MYPAESLEPEMWGKDQQFHSSFPLDIYENVFEFIFLRGHALNFTKQVF